MNFEDSWPYMTLREAGVTLIDCDHRTPQATEEGYPYIAIPQLKNGHIQLDGVRRISATDYVEWTKKLKPTENDVIVVRRCSSGDSAVVPAKFECAIGQNLVVLRADGTRVFPPFLRWLVRGPDWWEQVSKYINVGAVFDSLKCREIPHFELRVPPLSAQREIATVLGALDDRITLLRETNATLEAIAQVLFKSWFVDFDPVRARMEGRAPEGMDAATAALFPDSFEESELGWVPKGWRIGSLGSISEVGIGKTPPRKESHWFSENPADVRWVSIRDMGTSGAFIFKTSEYLTAESIDRFNVRKVPNNTVLLSFKMTIGRVAITEGEMTTNEAIAHCKLTSQSPLPSEYIYLHLKQFDYRTLSSTSSIADAVNSKAVKAIPILIPDANIVAVFKDSVRAVFERIKTIQQQTQTLASLRDTLLPRLISGQLRLPDAETRIEEAMA